MGLDGAGEGVSVSSARALATSGHRRGSTALQAGQCYFFCSSHHYTGLSVCRLLGTLLTRLSQMPHMNSSIPEFVDPRVRCTRVLCACSRCYGPLNSLQVANEPVQCAQKTEKGLSGYAYNKQTGLVNKVCSPPRFASHCFHACSTRRSTGSGAGASWWAHK